MDSINIIMYCMKNENRLQLFDNHFLGTTDNDYFDNQWICLYIYLINHLIGFKIWNLLLKKLSF